MKIRVQYITIKFILDITFSIISLITLLPIFLIISLLIIVESRGGVFYIQERVGMNGRRFMLIKFRTMCNNAQNIGSGIFTDKKDPRITKIGRILRMASIDELPQLINILKGDMSLIGPRPVPIANLDQYDPSDKRRLAVKPGLTGWAQVNGRNSLTWPEKIEKDLFYINNISFGLDCEIFFLTIKSILSAKGVYSGRYRNLIEKGQKENIKENKK